MRRLESLGYSSLYRPLFWLIAGACFVCGMGLWTPTTHADPHAVFYTVIGQQQLFFNVLAALDQADYVEPQQARDARLNARNSTTKDGQDIGAQFKEDEDPILKATKTDLSAVLTRGITLEGQDLWTTYLAYQAAKDRRGTLNANEDVRTLCDIATGRVNCEEDEAPQPDRAYIYDGNAFPERQITDGSLGALQSNVNPNSKDQRIRRDKLTPDDDQVATGRAWSSAIALLRKEAEDTGNRDQIDALLNITIPSTYSTSVDPSVFNDLTTDADGNLKLSLNIAGHRFGNSALAQSNSEVSGPAYAKAYASKLKSLMMLPPALLEEAAISKGYIENIQEAKSEDGGAVSVTTTHANASGNNTPGVGNVQGISTANAQGAGSTGVVHSVNEIIRTPPHLTRAAGQAAIQAIVDADANPQHVNVQGQFGPPDAEIGFGEGEVAGLSSATVSPEPRVLHAVSPFGDEDIPEHDQGKQTVLQGPGTLEKPFNAFSGPAHLLGLVTGEKFGCGCGVDYSVAKYYEKIKKKLI